MHIQNIETISHLLKISLRVYPNSRSLSANEFRKLTCKTLTFALFLFLFFVGRLLSKTRNYHVRKKYAFFPSPESVNVFSISKFSFFVSIIIDLNQYFAKVLKEKFILIAFVAKVTSNPRSKISENVKLDVILVIWMRLTASKNVN